MKWQNHARLRRGAAMVAAVVLLAVVVIVMSVSLRSVSTSQRITRQQGWQMQAEFLAESAIERTRGQLARNNEYRGEMWQLKISGAASISESGRVVIEVTRQGSSDNYDLSVTAIFPDQPVHRAQVKLQRQLTVTANNE